MSLPLQFSVRSGERAVLHNADVDITATFASPGGRNASEFVPLLPNFMVEGEPRCAALRCALPLVLATRPEALSKSGSAIKLTLDSNRPPPYLRCKAMYVWCLAN